jgi:8-oxo-dGTP diphosphatase
LSRFFGCTNHSAEDWRQTTSLKAPALRPCSWSVTAVSDARSYPERPYLAVSAAIVRDGKILVVRRARAPAHGLFSLPGGVVEVGETLTDAVTREVREETGMAIEPVALAGFRETIVRDAKGRVERHFIILCFAARWRAGEPVLNDELDDARWLDPAELTSLPTTPGLADIVAAAFDRLVPAQTKATSA